MPLEELEIKVERRDCKCVADDHIMHNGTMYIRGKTDKDMATAFLKLDGIEKVVFVNEDTNLLDMHNIMFK